MRTFVLFECFFISTSAYIFGGDPGTIGKQWSSYNENLGFSEDKHIIKKRDPLTFTIAAFVFTGLATYGYKKYQEHKAQNEQRKQQLPNEDGYQDDDSVDDDHYPDRDDDFLQQYYNAVTRRKFERENQGPPRDKLDEDQWDVRSGEPQPDIANEGPIFRGSFPNDGTYGNGKPVGNWPGN